MTWSPSTICPVTISVLTNQLFLDSHTMLFSIHDIYDYVLDIFYCLDLSRVGLSESLNHNKAQAMATVSSKVVRAGSTMSDCVSSSIPRSQKSPRPVEPRSSFELRSPRLSSAKPVESRHASERRLSNASNKSNDVDKLFESKHASERRLSNASNKSNDVDRLFELKTKVERRLSISSNTTPDRQSHKPKLNEVEENFEKTKEKLIISEMQNAKLLEELKNMKESTNEAHEKLKEFIVLKKDAEERLEIEKFRSDELEQIGIEACRKMEEDLEKERESMKNDLSLEVEKAAAFSNEISRLKSLLNSKNDGENSNEEELIKKLYSEVHFLKCELERTKEADRKLVNMEKLVEELNAEAERAHIAEHDSIKTIEESNKKTELLEIKLLEVEETLVSFKLQLEESNATQRNSEYEIASSREKIEIMQNQLDSSSESKSLLLEELEDAESEIISLQEKVKYLETEMNNMNQEKFNVQEIYQDIQKKDESTNLLSTSLAPFKEDYEKYNSSLKDALYEVDVLRKKLQSVEIELTCYKEKLMESERNLEESQQDAFEMGLKVDSLKSEIQSLSEEKLQKSDEILEERAKLIKDLEKYKKAVEKLSIETRELQERLSESRIENEDAHAQAQELILTLENTKENQEVMLDKAKYDIICLKKDIEKLDVEAKEKEISFENAIKASVHELASLKNDYETLKAKLVDLENELHCISQENVELKMREAASNQSINESSPKSLSSLNGLLTESVNGEKELDSEKPIKKENGQDHPCIVEKDNYDGRKSFIKDNDYSERMENEEKLVDELDSKIESDSLEKTNELPLEQKKKKPLFKKFGSLLKKRSLQNQL